MKEAQAASKRIPYLDVARSLAIISITFNHAVNRSFATESGQFAEFQSIPFFLTIVKVVLYAFSRLGVPLFVMISGALLLPRKYTGEGTAKFMKHNWLTLLITTELWLAIMFWYKQFAPDSVLFSQGIKQCLVQFIATLLFINPNTMGSMWYMPMILCVYLLIPILSAALREINYKYFLIPMAIVVFCSYILPDVNGVLAALGIQERLMTKLDSANVFSMYVVYLLLGFFISTGVLSKVKTRTLLAVSVISFILFCAFQTWFYSMEYDFTVAEGYHSIFPMITAVSLFTLLSRMKINENGFIYGLSSKLAVISLGVYFVHICIMEGLIVVLKQFALNISFLWKFVFLECISFFGSIAIIWLCRKNRMMEKYLFGIK